MTSFNFKKKYGQNFLQDNNIIYNIIDNIEATEDDLVIEIGPGGGALTKFIKKTGCKYIGYEIDTEVDQYLSQYQSDNFKFIYDDFLNRDVLADIQDIEYNNLFIVGNLPYYITTPIILKIIESNLDIKRMVFMVQKEVADRFAANIKTREYGSITVFLNYFFDVKKLFIVSKNCFYPIPNVDSAVIRFDKKDDILPVNIELFNKLVRDAFQFKRKNLRNNLKGYNLEKIEEVLKKYALSLNSRAEDVSYQIFVEIANSL